MGKTSSQLRKPLASKKLKRVSVVVTVFNEQDNIVKLVGALVNQTQKPAEIIIVDGGSRDTTYSLLKGLTKKYRNLRLYQVAGNRSVGRNFGVAHASSPIIAFTDAGCTPKSDWLEQIVAPFSDPKTHVVSGYYEGLATNSFQKALIPYVLVMPDKAENTEFYPSTRSMAIDRVTWNTSGGFDTRLNHNEDYAYAVWLKKMGIKFVFAKEAVVSWHPRKNLSEAAWMFLRFSLGDAQSGILRPKVRLLFIRYILLAYLFVFALESPSLFAIFLSLVLLYLIWAIVKNYHYVKDISAFFWLPVLQLTSDVVIISGTIMGFLNKK